MEFIHIGIIQKPFGIRGEIKVMPVTDFVETRFQTGKRILIRLNQHEKEYVIESLRFHQGSLLLKLEGLDSLSDVESFHRGEILIPAEERHELPEDEYYFSELKDCDVFCDGAKIGSVSEVMDMPAHPVLRIKTEGSDLLVPFVAVFIKDVDVDGKRIDIEWMEGLQ